LPAGHGGDLATTRGRRDADGAASRASAAAIDAPAGDSIEEGHDTLAVPGAHVQARAANAAEGVDVQAIAASGVRGPGEPLPYGDDLRRSFGRHADALDGATAHRDADAVGAAQAIGAEAYATGGSIAFAGSPTRELVGHEAAHIVQQRAGVSLKGGVGAPGDPYEHHADEVGAAFVRGESAEPLLDRMPGRGGSTSAVQRKPGNNWVNAALYLSGNDAAGKVTSSITSYVRSMPWPTAHARLPWRDPAAFAEQLAEHLALALHGFDPPGHIEALFHPSRPLQLVDEMRPTVPGAAPSSDNRFVGGRSAPMTGVRRSAPRSDSSRRRRSSSPCVGSARAGSASSTGSTTPASSMSRAASRRTR
jgi:hypothetical protein